MLWWTLRQLKASNPKSRQLATGKLAGVDDPRAIAALVTALADGVAAVRTGAANAIVMTGNPAVEALTSGFRDGRKHIGHRRAIVSALAQIISEAAGTVLLEAIDDKDADIAGYAIEGLGRMNDIRAVEPLIKKLPLAAAATALGKLKDERAIPGLIGALHSSVGETSQRSAARAALREIGGPAIASLRAELLRGSPGRREAAALALWLEMRSMWSPNDEERSWIALLTGSWDDVEQLGALSLEPLFCALRESFKVDDAKRSLSKLGLGAITAILAEAAVALARRQVHAEALLRLLDEIDPHWTMREGAAAVIHGIVGRLCSPYESWRTAALARLHRARWQPANEREMACLAVCENRWDEAAAMGDPAVDALSQMLQASDAPLSSELERRRNAARALARIGTARVVDPLVGLLLNSQGRAGMDAWAVAYSAHAASLRSVATEALQEIGPLAVDALIPTLAHESAWVRTTVIDALAQMPDPRAVDALIPSLKDTDLEVKQAAARALKRFASPRSTRALLEALEMKLAEAGPALQAVLERASEHLTKEELFGIIGLVPFTNHYSVKVNVCEMVQTEELREQRVDHVQLKQLARQELVRRGVSPSEQHQHSR